ncbi:MAG: hypothetical protein ACUVYA_09340 [Planctomycetota bacterium]
MGGRRKSGPPGRSGAARLAGAVASPSVLAALSFLATSCSLFVESPERTFVSNEALLEGLARSAGYLVDPSLHRLIRAEIFEDSLTLQYRGERHPGDAAWVVRFSVKSSEQDPDSVADIATVLPVLAEGRDRFEVTEHGKRDVAGVEVQFARYRFQSPARDPDARPLEGRGILAAFVSEEGGGKVAYHVKLDNQGDRDDLGWDDLAPFLVPALGAKAGSAAGLGGRR